MKESKDVGAQRDKMKYEYQWRAGKCLPTGSAKKRNPGMECLPVSMYIAAATEDFKLPV